MRSVLSLLVLIAFSAPSFASEKNETQRPIFVKGSKSYQMRYIKAPVSPASVEPAAGTEIEKINRSENISENVQESEVMSSKKAMKLHGKK